MRKKKTQYYWVILFAAFLFLILDSKCAATGISIGLELCIRTVIPAIFPFLILSPLLVSQIPQLSFLHPLNKLLKIPAGSERILITSFLCGYPVGAQMVNDAWINGRLSTADAKRMLAFCNNAGPAFIFGIGGSLFQELWVPWALWCIHIISAVAVGVMLPGSSCQRNTMLLYQNTSFREQLQKGVVTMGYICGWVIMFRMIESFLQKWVLWLLPNWCTVLFFGFLELSSGCVATQSFVDPSVRFLFLSAFFAFGGICVHMQTASVTSNLNAVTIHLTGKVLHCMISILLSAILLLILNIGDAVPILVAVLAIVTAILTFIIFILRRKKSSIMQLCSV